MSVAPLTAREIATFAAICHRENLLPYEPLLPLCRLITEGNAAAWAATYSDTIDPAADEDLERELFAALNDESIRETTHFGPLAYNMIANNGEAFIKRYGSDVGQGHKLLELVRQLEDKAREWQESRQRTMQRAEQNAVAWNEVGQLPTLTCDEIADRCRAAGCQRVIVARFMVDESEIQSDYFGGRQTREVVIGFGKGKRENFRQLRKAAATFAPTDDFGPGCDEWTPRVVLADDVQSNGSCYWKGSYSHWHRELDGCGNHTFRTEAEAKAFADQQGPPEPIVFQTKDGDQLVHFRWELQRKSVEQRENYSMGGGNYLGRDRYSGWKVSSTPVDYFRGTGTQEYHEAK